MPLHHHEQLQQQQFRTEWKSKTGKLSSDFFLVSSVGQVMEPVRKRDYIPILLFVAMLAWYVMVVLLCLTSSTAVSHCYK
jgi:hypothetical protein